MIDQKDTEYKYKQKGLYNHYNNYRARIVWKDCDLKREIILNLFGGLSKALTKLYIILRQNKKSWRQISLY